MATPSDEVEALIRRIGEQWAQHWNARQLARLMEAYAADAVYMPPHHAAVHGRQAIEDYLRGPMQHGVTDLTYDVTYIRHSGDLAYDVGRYSMTVPQKDSSKRQDKGKYLTVWKRQADGSWKIVADTFSSDLPPA